MMLMAQTPDISNDQQEHRRTVGVQYNPAVDSVALALQQRPLKLIEGFSLSGDLLGLVMYKVANYGQIEAALRINMKGTYFPILEVGLGHSDHKDDETDLYYKTYSPYFRVGCDYNFARDKHSGNRLYAGLRIGYCNFKYDLSGPDLIDPIWSTSIPYDFNGLSSNCLWSELAFGIEAKIWENFHMGWSIRYRMRIKQDTPEIGQAWYVPGFGINDTHNFGGTFNLIFDL